MILSDREIAAALLHKLIVIDPQPDRELWTSTAVDLTLDPVIVRWKDPPKPGGTGAPDEPLHVYPAGPTFSITQMLDNDNYAERISIENSGYELRPRQFVLGYTAQRIYLPNATRISARVEGKSSLARLGVGVHVTAPTIHAGFGYRTNPEKAGIPIQLEIFNLGPFVVHLRAGMPICQLILEEVRETPNKGYGGRFADQRSFSAPS
jgi:dCTP deaminase